MPPKQSFICSICFQEKASKQSLQRHQEMACMLVDFLKLSPERRLITLDALKAHTMQEPGVTLVSNSITVSDFSKKFTKYEYILTDSTSKLCYDTKCGKVIGYRDGNSILKLLNEHIDVLDRSDIPYVLEVPKDIELNKLL